MRRLPVGVNLVARVRLEYPPATRERLPVIAQLLAIRDRMLPYLVWEIKKEKAEMRMTKQNGRKDGEGHVQIDLKA